MNVNKYTRECPVAYEKNQKRELVLCVAAAACFVIAVLVMNPLSPKNTSFMEKGVNAQIQKTEKLAKAYQP